MIAPGNYPTKTGSVTITDDGNGKASFKHEYKGFDLASEMNAPTILGGIIRSKIAEAVPQGLQTAANNFAPAVQGVQTAATQAIDTVAPVLGNIKTGASNLVGGLFGGLFGGAPPAVPRTGLGVGTWGNLAGAPVVQTSPFGRPPMPLTPSPMLRTGNRPAGNTVVNRSGETYDQRRTRQIAEDKASQLDQFGMII
jgi:hypothetical protein